MATCIGTDLGTTNTVATFRKARTVQFVESEPRPIPGEKGGTGCRWGLVDFDKPGGKVPCKVEIFPPMPSGQFPDAIAGLVSDEVGNDAKSIPQIISTLTSAGVTPHVVGVIGSCHQRIARETEGRFWNISDTRSVDFGELLSRIASEAADMTLRHSD